MSSTGLTGARPGSEPIPDGTDDLRTRMKLRLAQNKAHAERESAARPVPVASSFTTAPPVSSGVRERPTGNGVSQMVWNSVLDSISTPAAAPTSAPVAPAPRSAPRPATVEVLPVEVLPVEAAAVEAAPVAPVLPAAVDAEEQEAIAELFKEPAPTPDFGPIVPAMPVLAPPSRYVPPQRTITPSVEDELAPVVTVPSKKEAKRAAKSAPVPAAKPMPATMMALHQRKKRHPIRSFLTFVLVLGLLGGAGFAGWYKFLRHSAVWPSELRPTAAFVEQTVHRSFDKTVPVKALSVPEYEVKLGLSVLDQLGATATTAPAAAGSTQPAATTPGPDLNLLAVRAVGLIGADLQPTEVGHLVAASSPSFYSAADHTIYRLAGDGPVLQVSLLRSMTAALLDQDLGVQTVMRTLTVSQQSGFQAMLDGVVAQVVAAKFRADPSVQDSYTFDLQTRRTDAGIVDGKLPVYLSKVVTSADVGVFGFAGVKADNPLQNLAPPVSDAPVFDPTRDIAAAPAKVPGSGDSQERRVLGVEFWFDALVPALGAGDARAAALLWTGDQSVSTLADSRACLSSTIATATAADATTLSGYLGRWVQSVPASAHAVITPGTDPAQPSVALSICEPTEAVVPPVAPLDDLASFFTQPDTERALLARVSDLGGESKPAINGCVVAAYRNGSLPGFTSGAADPVMVTALKNVVTFCRSAG